MVYDAAGVVSVYLGALGALGVAALHLATHGALLDRALVAAAMDAAAVPLHDSEAGES